MRKSLFLFVISGVLSLSILAPSVCTLLEISVETSLVQETDDESKKEKTEKELEEKQWDTPRENNALLGFTQLSQNNFGTYISGYTLPAKEVSSPPPEGMTRL
ncbi:hypothetical protein [Gilvibacter sediminis]|uniref:hypothetical protein n=1 Tax=Gilvibacter sediminis TaxID=379071 RepID=UPI00235010AB|nr:hypothetical protein [Gilvibacter sediminis]MDC7998058.1 hypothetical protein [Gilvibacter sediminis]